MELELLGIPKQKINQLSKNILQYRKFSKYFNTNIMITNQ